MQLVTKIRLFGEPYTVSYISEDDVVFPNAEVYKALGFERHNSCDIFVNSEDDSSGRKPLRLVTSAHFLRPFLRECIQSDIYRWKVLTHLRELSGIPDTETVFFKLILDPPDKELIDYAWNDRILRIVWSRVEIENAFSWLSTLGGAYSALGDYFENCAEEAGRISQRQYKLSMMLGDDSLAARSQLYSAISWAQKGNLKLARHITRHVASFARDTKDKRLLRMCQGVWAKLKYMRAQKRGSTSHLIKEDGDKKVDV